MDKSGKDFALVVQEFIDIKTRQDGVFQECSDKCLVVRILFRQFLFLLEYFVTNVISGISIAYLCWLLYGSLHVSLYTCSFNHM